MLSLIAYTKQGAKLRRILHPAKLFAVFFRKTYSMVTKIKYYFLDEVSPQVLYIIRLSA